MWPLKQGIDERFESTFFPLNYISKCFACSRRSYSQISLSTRQNVLVPAHCTGINGVRMAHHISFASKLTYRFNSTWYLVVIILGKFQNHHSKTFFFSEESA